MGQKDTSRPTREPKHLGSRAGPWRLPFVLALALVFLSMSACGSSRLRRELGEHRHRYLSENGVLHTVEPGQTLWRIAQAYEVSVQLLAEINDLEDPSRIEVGQALWIPGARRVVKLKSLPASSTQVASGSRAAPTPAGPSKGKSSGASPANSGVSTQKSRFIWPVKGVLYSRFGVRNGVQHDGIDIAAPAGSEVVAADDGEVLFVGEQRGYGNLVLILHDDGLVTIYAHNSRNLTKQGARVRRGEKIAEVGRTGRASGPHLHFEVREKRIPRNPLFFLP